ncbi:6452_t:CDS:2 [Cetraspora pellucida]|uniref:6452_t:CDS:1 n=1 Tax=Cetraspora pellucida TaxID=1433469 RepID=A0A9N8Z6H1_9GLOM|nr:6452_t:CDS:2 [Cetraspora pellucida]
MYGGNANNVTIQQQPVSQLGPPPSRVYFVDYNTKTITWNDPRLSISNKITAQQKISHENTLIESYHPLLFQLLIGDIAEIDVNDWKKHTDYREYAESDKIIYTYDRGTAKRNYIYCNSLQEHLAFPLTGSKTYREVMNFVDSQLKKQ